MIPTPEDHTTGWTIPLTAFMGQMLAVNPSQAERTALCECEHGDVSKIVELLMLLSEHLHVYSAFQPEPAVPWTNNATESAIGNIKMRARTVRGYISWRGMDADLLLSGIQIK